MPRNLFDRALRDEVRSTRRLVRTLGAAGIGVRFGRPLGLLGGKLLRRDHKKLVLFDDRVAYVGGLNFSEHNFEWHDLMVRIEHAEVTRFLGRDFLHSWEGRSEGVVAVLSRGVELDLHTLPGKGNHEHYGGLLDMIDRAERSIHMVGPYVSPPFTRASRSRGRIAGSRSTSSPRATTTRRTCRDTSSPRPRAPRSISGCTGAA